MGTTTTWWVRRTRGATIGIVADSAIITVTQLTIVKQLWAIACVAAKCSLIVPRSSSLEEAIPRNLRLRLRPLRLPLLRLRLLQLLRPLLLRRLLQVHLLHLHPVMVRALACGIRIVR